MTYAIVYSSCTGNTKRLAEVIERALPKENCVYCGMVSEAWEDGSEDRDGSAEGAGSMGGDAEKGDAAKRRASTADMIYAGFWTDKGTCDEEMARFLRGLAGKKVFLFGTAGFGQSAEYFSRILGNVASFLDKSCCLTGTFMCQGRMAGAVRERYERMLENGEDEEKVRGWIENFDVALRHPDEGDAGRLKEMVEDVWWGTDRENDGE